jgi:hypothetical protein
MTGVDCKLIEMEPGIRRTMGTDAVELVCDHNVLLRQAVANARPNTL